MVVYRSLPSILPSFYSEQRRINVRHQNFDGIQHRYGNEFAEDCHEDFVTFYTKIWDKPEFGDPLSTFETFSFFFKSVRVLQLNHPQKIDILDQFVCIAMNAKNTCKFLKDLRPSEPINKRVPKEKFLFDEDLIVFEAKKRNLLFSKKQNKKCKRELNRFEHASFLKFKLSKLNLTVRDLERKCFNSGVT